ncbi:hypothetical protein BJ546DRAFT_204636 [Cryomyces antarcticus]
MATQASIVAVQDTESVSEDLSSAPGSSILEVPTNLQRTNDFRSTAAQEEPSQAVNNSDYYSGINWDIPSLKLFGPTELPEEKGSHIWKHGWRVLHIRKGEHYWLCRKCHLKGSVGVYKVEKGLSGVHSHLKASHNTGPQGAIKQHPYEKRQQNDTMERSDFINEYCSKFMASEFKGLVLAWVVEDNKAFNSMESKALQKMLARVVIKRAEARSCKQDSWQARVKRAFYSIKQYQARGGESAW